MGFGIKLDVKVEAPKVALPKVDVAAAVSGVTGAVTGAVAGATAAVTGAVGAVTGAVTAAASAAAGAAAALSSVAGAIADVAVSFTGATVDLVLEPHLVLDANASYEDTKFETGSVWIRVDLSPSDAQNCEDTLHLFSVSGSYDESLRVCDNFVPSAADSDGSTAAADVSSVDIEFAKAAMSERYSLEIIPKDGDAYFSFGNTAYGNIGKDPGSPSPESD